MRAKNLSSGLLGLIALLVVAVAGCNDPLSMKRGYQAGLPAVAAGDARLVIQTRQGMEQTGRAALDDASYLTLRLQSTSAGQVIEKYASASKEGDGSYVVSVPGMIPGVWKASVRFYADSTASVMLAYANKSVYIAVGSSTVVDLNVYLPGAFAGANLSIAKTVSTVEIDDGATLWGSSISNPNLGPSVPRGKNIQLHASNWSAELDGDGFPIAATDQRVSWSSSDEDVVEMTSSGTLRALSTGTADIRATSAEGLVQTVITVQVEDPIVGQWFSTIGVVDESLKVTKDAGSFVFVQSYFDSAAQYLQYRRGTVTALGAGEYQFLASEYLSLGSMTWVSSEVGSTFLVHLQGLDQVTRFGMEEYPTAFTRSVGYVPVSNLVFDGVYNPNLMTGDSIQEFLVTTNPGATSTKIYWSTPNAAVVSLTVDPQGRPGGTFVYNSGTTYPASVSLIARSVDDPTKMLEIPFLITRASYTVTFDANGATPGGGPSPTVYGDGDQVTAPSEGDNGLANTGYLLTAWTTGADGSGASYAPGQSFMVASDVTLYAQWVGIYELSYDSNGADSGGVPSGLTAPSGTSMNVATNTGGLGKTGYNLLGWNTAADGSGAFYGLGQTGAFAMPSGPVVLYAVWGTNLVTESWEGGSGSWAMEVDTYGANSWTLNGPARTGTHGARNSYSNSEATYTITDVNTLGLSYDFLATPGQSIDFSFYVGNDGAATYWATLYLFDSLGNQVGYVEVPASVVTGSDGWKRVDLRIDGGPAYSDVKQIILLLGGHDGIGWYGYYGSWIDDVSLDLIPTPSN